VIDLLGLVIFATIIGIGLLDLRSGLGPFALYRSEESRTAVIRLLVQ
jgi:hypothetical protein